MVLDVNTELQPLYYPISDFYRKRFGGRVQKISVSLADDCPNRRGLKGMKVCSFCDEWGSAAYPEFRTQDLIQQIQTVQTQKDKVRESAGYLVYFQAYTNTFLKLAKLEAAFEAALSMPKVLGLVVGTRPDCISPAVLKLWQKYHEQAFVSVELGLQSFEDRHLEFYRRGHSVQDSLDAIQLIRGETSVDLGIHLMFGNPGEDLEEIRVAAEKTSALPIDNVKLHNLHVLKGTPLADLFAQGEFAPIDLPTYAQRVAYFLDRLRPDIAVHRLTATSSRWDELIAPEWTKHHLKSYQFVLNTMKDMGCYQGRSVTPRLRPHPVSSHL
jgi:radical SAM protein (TIGR01212 family)